MSVYYSDDKVTLYHGDCLELADELTVTAHSIVTDPPFFMPAQQYAGRGGSWERTWSDTSILAHWWRSVVGAYAPKVVENGHFMTFCDDESYAVFFPEVYRHWPNLACLVWDKGRPGMGSAWRQSSELIIAARGRSAYWGGGAMGTVLRHPPLDASSRVHPVDKPTSLLSQMIEPTTPPGGTVIDPFAGGGSTLVAAKALGRKAIGVELEERYCEIAARRLSQEVFDFGSIA